MRGKPDYDGHNKRSLKGASQRDIRRRRSRRKARAGLRDALRQQAWGGTR